jgi:hypothetical protein
VAEVVVCGGFVYEAERSGDTSGCAEAIMGSWKAATDLGGHSYEAGT